MLTGGLKPIFEAANTLVVFFISSLRNRCADGFAPRTFVAARAHPPQATGAVWPRLGRGGFPQLRRAAGVAHKSVPG
jgi:hypothetical protein